MRAANIGIARAALDAGMLGWRKDAVAPYHILIVQTVAAQGIGRPLAPVAHVAEEVAIVAHLRILGHQLQGSHGAGERERTRQQELFHWFHHR